MVRASPAEKALAKSIMSQRNYLVLLNSLANQYGGSRANAQEIHALEQRVMRKWRQELANISAVMAREQHGGMFQPPPALNPIVAPVNAAAVRDVHDLNKVEVDRILGKARLANAAVKQSQASLKEISRLLDDISAMQRHAADAQARINGLTAEKTAAEIARDGLLAELASLRDQLAAAGAERDRHAGIAVGHGNERDALRDERDVLVAANAAAAGAHGVDLAAANAARDVLQAERDALIVQRDQLILDLTAAQTAVAAIQALLDTANAEKNTLEETKAAMTAAYNVLIDKYNDLDDLLSDDALPIDDVAEMLEKQELLS
jgi:predicted nuclease with TOPRIM domain